MKKFIPDLLILIAILGIIDAGYLTYEHFSGTIPPCAPGIFNDCGTVLTSKFATPFGIPLALIGLIHYSLETLIFVLYNFTKKRIYGILGVAFSFIGFLASLYFVFLQLVVIRALCQYCMVSALISFVIFVLVHWYFYKERKILFSTIIAFFYQNILKRIFFLFDPEFVHIRMVKSGVIIGASRILKTCTSYVFEYKNTKLTQDFFDIEFKNPIGLAAGFDYHADLTQTLSSVGFGFQSIGTITNLAYEGNPYPRLGRLPKSKSLMVNKGYKNLGAIATIKKLQDILSSRARSRKNFPIPLGVSIGRTNSRENVTQKESVLDIIEAFKLFEHSGLPFHYYELNISCPNLYGNVSFYPPKNLDQLLASVDKLKIKRPIFVKMPIEKTNREFLQMIEVIAKHSPKGLIIGNLQKDRKHPSLEPEEVAKFTVGNFSGKPCFDRSNELIALAYKKYKKRFLIIGCGGVFSASDAYEKIKRGASLVQLITGMIFQGPQLIGQINLGLTDLLAKDGYHHISEAIGSIHTRKR